MVGWEGAGGGGLMSVEVVQFKGEGVTCVADLLLPEDDGTDGPRPAIVIGRGFGGVRAANFKEAQYLAGAGYIVLSIDYRTLGDSEGEPRAQAFPLAHAEDFRNAISYLEPARRSTLVGSACGAPASPGASCCTPPRSTAAFGPSSGRCRSCTAGTGCAR